MKLDFIKNNFGFKKVVFFNDEALGVAFTNIKSQILFINCKKFYSLPFEHQFFIIAHEEGHNVLFTKDELAADAYAYKRFEKMNFTNVKALEALHLFLDQNNPVHKARLWAQYQRGLHNDFTEFNIKSAYREKYETVSEIKQKLKQILHG